MAAWCHMAARRLQQQRRANGVTSVAALLPLLLPQAVAVAATMAGTRCHRRSCGLPL